MRRIRVLFSGTVVLPTRSVEVTKGEEIEVQADIAEDLTRPERSCGFEPVGWERKPAPIVEEPAPSLEDPAPSLAESPVFRRPKPKEPSGFGVYFGYVDPAILREVDRLMERIDPVTAEEVPQE